MFKLLRIPGQTQPRDFCVSPPFSLDFSFKTLWQNAILHKSSWEKFTHKKFLAAEHTFSCSPFLHNYYHFRFSVFRITWRANKHFSVFFFPFVYFSLITTAQDFYRWGFCRWHERMKKAHLNTYFFNSLGTAIHSQ